MRRLLLPLTAALALAPAGCLINRYSSDPAVRLKQVLPDTPDAQDVRRQQREFFNAPQPVAQASVPAPPAPAPPPPPTLLTVANVRKEPALLFTVKPEGDLTFVAKVPPGEAIDLTAAAGQRWVAVFPDGTHCATGPTSVWLLRQPSAGGR